MKKIESLTKDQEAKILQVRDEWINFAASGKIIERAKCEKLVEWLYKESKLEKPIVVFVDSPLGAQMAVAYVKELLKFRKGFSSAQVRAQVGDQVRDQVGAQVGDQVRAQVGAQVWAQVGDQVNWYCGYGLHDANWLAWLDYFERAVGLKFATPISGLLESGRSCGWYWPYSGAVLFTERPTRLRRDTQHRLHSGDGAAIQYPDDWGIWAWHGVRVPRQVIEQPESLNPQDVVKEPNAEVRRVMVERLGVDRFLAGVKAKVRHEDNDSLGHKRRLLEVAQREDEELVAVEVTNSTREPDGTWKSYILRVPPAMRTCAQAVAWTFDLSDREYQPAMES